MTPIVRQHMKPNHTVDSNKKDYALMKGAESKKNATMVKIQIRIQSMRLFLTEM